MMKSMRLALSLLCPLALIQQPPPGNAPTLQHMLPNAPEPGLVMLAIAAEYVAAGYPKQAIKWLQQASDLNPEYNPAASREFAPLAGLPEFEALAARARTASPPVGNSRLAATVPEKDLIPEGIAIDPQSRKLYLSSINKSKIVEISPEGHARDFVVEGHGGLGQVLGMKLDSRTNTLWAASNNKEHAGVFHFDLATGRLLGKHLTAPGPLFNDLVVTSKGDVFITASRAGALYWISSHTRILAEWRPGLKLSQANGIALSPDEKVLFVSTFPDGITAINLESGTVRPLPRPANVSLASIDGLYYHDNSLILVQNADVSHRIARLFLTPSLDRATRLEVLERGNPLFDIPTTGTLSAGSIYYIANSQLLNFGPAGIIDPAKIRPISILHLKLE